MTFLILLWTGFFMAAGSVYFGKKALVAISNQKKFLENKKNGMYHLKHVLIEDRNTLEYNGIGLDIDHPPKVTLICTGYRGEEIALESPYSAIEKLEKIAVSKEYDNNKKQYSKLIINRDISVNDLNLFVLHEIEDTLFKEGK